MPSPRVNSAAAAGLQPQERRRQGRSEVLPARGEFQPGTPRHLGARTRRRPRRSHSTAPGWSQCPPSPSPAETTGSPQVHARGPPPPPPGGAPPPRPPGQRFPTPHRSPRPPAPQASPAPPHPCPSRRSHILVQSRRTGQARTGTGIRVRGAARAPGSPGGGESAPLTSSCPPSWRRPWPWP